MGPRNRGAKYKTLFGQSVNFFRRSGISQQHLYHRVTRKNWKRILYALTLSNINGFSKLFHCQNQEKIANNSTTQDPTTP